MNTLQNTIYLEIFITRTNINVNKIIPTYHLQTFLFSIYFFISNLRIYQKDIFSTV